MIKKLENIPQILLMGPGPSCVHPEVYKALACSTIGHMDPQFLEIMDEIRKLMHAVLNTENRCTLPMSGTGSAGMETCFVNLMERDDSVLILENGVFGRRMADVARRLGGVVDTLSFPWGTPVIVEDVKKRLSEKKYSLVAVVHAETSTGVRNPVKEIGELLQAEDSIYLVDAVTSMGGIEVRTDDWRIDALYSGSQKCLSCPPGIAPVTFSERAVEKLMNRNTKVPNWYLDVSMIMNYWSGAKRVYHHTAPINMLYAIYQALFEVVDEGLDAVYERHLTNHNLLVNGLSDLGLKMLVDPEYRLPQLNSVLVPDGVDEAQVRSQLRNQFRIEIGAGLGDLAGKIWRIGLMGYTSSQENVEKVLKALKACIRN